MLIHTANIFKLLVTIRTDERLFTSVNSAMHTLFASSFKRLVTISTGERFTFSPDEIMLDDDRNVLNEALGRGFELQLK